MKNHAVLLIFIFVTLAWMLLGHPFPQDPAYHNSAN